MAGLREARPQYQEVRRFRNRQAFLNWWRNGEEIAWRINSRNANREGVVEYWKCAFKIDKTFACLASLRIVFGHHDRYVAVSRNVLQPHNHTEIRVLQNGANTEENEFREVRPFPMQTAQIVHFGPHQPSENAHQNNENTTTTTISNTSTSTALEVGTATPTTPAAIREYNELEQQSTSTGQNRGNELAIQRNPFLAMQQQQQQQSLVVFGGPGTQGGLSNGTRVRSYY